jgi:hypothetical protein
MQLKASDVLEARIVRRPLEESGQTLDLADVALLLCWVFGDSFRIVMCLIMCRRTGLMTSLVMLVIMS